MSAQTVQATPQKAAGHLWPALFAAAALLSTVTLSAHAQQSREILIGTVGAASTETPATSGAATAPTHGRNRDAEADRLLKQARTDLSIGDIGAARQQLTALVQRYNETRAAQDARRVLSRVEASLTDERASASASAVDGADSLVSPGSQGRVGREPSSSWDPRLDAMRAPSRAQSRLSDGSAEYIRAKLDQDFRATVGDRVFFSDGSAELGARARQVLAAQAQWLIRNPDVTVTVEAHADDVGSVDYNGVVARQRGQAVRDLLIEQGVPQERIRVTALGRDRRLATCTVAACAAQNRRVVTAISRTLAGRSGESPPRAALTTGRRD